MGWDKAKDGMSDGTASCCDFSYTRDRAGSEKSGELGGRNWDQRCKRAEVVTCLEGRREG
ncbi:hypothetical protein SERLA73DRAFT_121803 [Serpula lacrymans var. lacrymans S7.3]|uniref:Uncharacterized protein n=1 Tax=Serpula lacrymans var. lacrymans (strain S7.3) TaxID=936435 RepID=F8PUF5_SERL3|nr:hypothetical protein SERLA73DRAFT_121803 [Serpula lacrymans var. lacrymans S7.3]